MLINKAYKFRIYPTI
ncbi:helix-turn-helix domain-containing protein, partial [Ferdinandcohnia quinoae]